MKKKLCLALLSTLMLTACSSGGPSSGGSQIEDSSSKPSTEVSTTPSSTTPSSSVDPTPVFKTITLEEAQTQAKAMATYINSDKYVEPQSYQFITGQKFKDAENYQYTKMTFTVNRAQEKMSMYLYDRYGAEAKPILGRWLSKKEAGSYYHQEQTVKSKQYEIVAATDFEAALGTAKLTGEQSYKDSVGKGTVKAGSLGMVDAFAKFDFSTVTGVTSKFKGNGEDRMEMYFEKVTTNEDSTKNTVKYSLAFEKYNLVAFDATLKQLSADGTTLSEKKQFQGFDYRTWTIDVPPVDDTWSEIGK